MLRQRARKAEHKEERRGAIMAAAHEMYRDTPFAQITMAAVAERAGISKGTVYLYFVT